MAEAPGYRLRPAARADLTEIWQTGAESWGPDQADRYFDGLVALFALLAEQPGIARPRDEFTPPVRLHPYRAHVVVYDGPPGAIEVIRILHNRRNLLATLDG